MVTTRVDSLLRSAPAFLRRQAKTLRQTAHGWGHQTRLGFVFGCQRSGTKMLMRVLDLVPDTRIYHENHRIAFDDFELRSDRVVRALVALNPAPVQVFKPICDSHRADELLATHPLARGLWIVRSPDDVARSALRKWSDHQRDVVQSILDGTDAQWGWRTARISPEVRAQLRDATGGTVSPEEGALLFWWLRNQFFFALGLDQAPRMRLVHYEQLVADPEAAFPPAFTHLGVGYAPRFVAGVRDTSDRATEPLPARSAVRALCDDLVARFAAYTPAPRIRTSPILVFIDTLNTGGAERYSVTVANHLAATGLEVTHASAGGDMEDELAPEVHRVHGPVAQVRGRLPQAALWLRGHLHARPYQAIICNSLATTLIARLAQPIRQIPIVNVAHGWPEERFSIVAPPMQVADRVVAVSPDVARKLVAGGLDEARVTVVYNGVDCTPLYRRTGAARQAARAVLGGADPGTLVVLAVGRLEAQKAHQHIFHIAAQTRDTLPHVRFALVGGGSREQELSALADSLGVADRVHLLGLRRDVPDLLGSADLFLNCSDWEGMPLTTIEAMASGLPIIATHTEGADQLLDPGCGVVTDVGDVASMAQAIGDLATDDARRRRMGHAARLRALAHFSHERMVDQLLDVVASVAR